MKTIEEHLTHYAAHHRDRRNIATHFAIGPIFVCAEAFFLLGAKAELRRRIEERTGPTVARRERGVRA